MIRALVCIFAIGFAASALSQAADAPAGKIPKDTCVKPCQECANECLACMKHCRENKMEDTARQCEICHHGCLMCAVAVGGKNDRSEVICALCETICNDTAAMCEKGTNEQMKKCAVACRNCAKACAEARK